MSVRAIRQAEWEPRRCKCRWCNSELEFTTKDERIVSLVGSFINCPVCGNDTLTQPPATTREMIAVAIIALSLIALPVWFVLGPVASWING